MKETTALVGIACHFYDLETMPYQELSGPFMLETFWLWEDDERASDIIEAEMKDKVYRGNMELINLGCGMSYRLIVTGNCRGEVWNYTDCSGQAFL